LPNHNPDVEKSGSFSVWNDDTMFKESALGNEKRDLIFLVPFALALRMLLYKWTYVIAIDGTGFYLIPAQYFASGRWMNGLAIGYHPLYPMLVAFFSKVIGDFQLSGQMVSVLFGTLTVIPIYYLARGAFSGWTAFISSLFLAILPRHVALSADFLSDPTYTFFFISAVWLGWEALRRDDWKTIFCAGLATGLAYLTRAEGIGVLLVLGPWLLFRGVRSPSWDYRRNGFACFMLLFSFLLVASPYILYLRSYTGTWTISRKPAVDRVVVLIKSKLFFQKPKVAKATEEFDDIVQRLREEKEVPTRGLSKWLIGLGSFCKFFVETFHPLLFLLFIMGLIRRKAPPHWGEREAFLLVVVCLYALVLYWLSILSYITHRYFVFFVALCLIWSGRGLRELHHWLLQRVPSGRLGKINITATRGIVLLTAMTVVIILPMSIHPQRAGKQGEKEAGLWIKKHSISSPTVYTDMVRVNYYAGGTLVFLKDERILYDEIIKRARTTEADFLVIRGEKIESLCPGFFKSRRPEDLEEVFRSNKGGRETIIVYRIQRQ
jgi:4-amino-4-deoxy-L-arabinose transferase-like glycosyltransferase